MRRFLPIAGLCLLAACAGNAPRKYVVFFSARSTELDDNARNVLSQVADESRKHPSRIVKVEGYAHAGHDLSADALLAIQRAKAVAQQLSEDGVAGDHIVQTPRAPSSSEGMQVGSRRVEIELANP